MIDVKLLRECADRAYNYRWKIGKDEFRGLYGLIQILEYAETKGIEIKTAQDFQNLLTKLQGEQKKLDNEAQEKYLKKHSKPSLKGKKYCGLKNKDWRDWILCDGKEVFPL
jgi:hypothetical protein